MAGHIRRFGVGGVVRLLSPTVISISLLTTPSLAQTGWETVAGGPYFERNPLCAAVIDSLHAVVGGRNGYIARTSDAGMSWIRVYTGSTDDFTGISFSDGERGTIVGGRQATILRTVDGGITWRVQSNGPFTPSERFSSVSFSDSVNGVIVSLDGGIYRTTDGGEEWLSASPTLYRGLLRVRLRSSYGLAVGRAGDTYRTSDRGRTWYFHSAMTYPRDLHDAFLVDSVNAFVAGDGGVIRRTTDGGIFWTAVSSGTTADLRSVSFFDGSNGIIGASDGTFLRTTDGGTSWSPPVPGAMGSVREAVFASPAFGLCIAESDGAIFRTTDAGTSWDGLEYSWNGAFFGVCAAGPARAFAVGEEGMIAASSDSGRNWTRTPAPTSAALRDIRFYGPGEGWIAGDSGVVMRTTDGGTSWALIRTPATDDLRALAARAPGVATFVGRNNTILGTSDGGSSWVAHECPVFDHWEAVSFLDELSGVAAGLNGSIIRTTDGGESWGLILDAGSLSDVGYIDPLHLYAVGAGTGDSLRGLFLSSDGGGSWSFRRLSGWEITGGSFVNAVSGYVSGGIGGLFNTQDSGVSWVDRSPSAAAFHAVAMAGPRAAYAAGDSGVIARMRADCAVVGRCFHDLDHDGREDAGEGGLKGWPVFLGGPFGDTTFSAPDGTYEFRSLPYGTYTIRPKDAQFWEQTAPASFTADTITVSPGSELGAGSDLGFAGPDVRIRIPVFVRDSTSFAHRYVWWGIRPGATYGIWGTDPGASVMDSLDGEFEIPPRSFAELTGIFDARFSDPYYPLNGTSDRFGEGSWTDMRPYRFRSQRDTFLLSFLPGYYFGGDYPMTISWSPALVAKSFNGPVVLIDPHGAATDMKSAGSLTISDVSIESLLLVAQSPHFPREWLANWRLFSLPAPAGDGSVRSLFPSAGSRAWSFVPGAGYAVGDTLRPNTGYWLKYASALDSISYDPGARVRDTVGVSRGWNLVGSLSAPVDVTSVTTEPAGLGLGYFFGYDDGYSVADSLLPGKAYWVRSDGDGSMVLEAGASAIAGASLARPAYDRALSRLHPVRIEDAENNAGTIYLADGGDDLGLSGVELPPSPPDGAFDVRFAAGRLAAEIRAGASSRHPVLVSSARFPLTVTLPPGAPSPVHLDVGGQLFALQPGSPVTVPGPAVSRDADAGTRMTLTLVFTGGPGVPAEFALLQNYPNPFNPATLISYALPAQSRVTITVYDLLGREVVVLVDEEKEAGYQSIAWSADRVSSGVYFCRMDAVSVADPGRVFSAVRKLLVVR